MFGTCASFCVNNVRLSSCCLFACLLGRSFYFDEGTGTSVFPHMMSRDQQTNFSQLNMVFLLSKSDINFCSNVYPTYTTLPYLRQSRGRDVVDASLEIWLPMPRTSLHAVSHIIYTSLIDYILTFTNDQYMIVRKLL